MSCFSKLVCDEEDVFILGLFKQIEGLYGPIRGSLVNAIPELAGLSVLDLLPGVKDFIPSGDTVLFSASIIGLLSSAILGTRMFTKDGEKMNKALVLASMTAHLSSFLVLISRLPNKSAYVKSLWDNFKDHMLTLVSTLWSWITDKSKVDEFERVLEVGAFYDRNEDVEFYNLSTPESLQNILSMSTPALVTLIVSFIGFILWCASSLFTSETFIKKVTNFKLFMDVATRSNGAVNFLADELFGMDLSGSRDFLERFEVLSRQLQNSLSTSVAYFNLFPTIRQNFVELTARFDVMYGEIVRNRQYAKLINSASILRTRISEHQSKISMAYGVASHRFEPVVVYIYGEAGVGKSTYVVDQLIPDICDKLKLTKACYNMTVTKGTNFYAPYRNEMMAYVDEFGSLGKEDFVVAEFNKLVNVLPYTGEAAQIDFKTQNFNFYIMFVISNYDIPAMPKDSGLASQEGLLRRITPGYLLTRALDMNGIPLVPVKGSLDHLNFLRTESALNSAVPVRSVRYSHDQLVKETTARFLVNRDKWIYTARHAFQPDKIQTIRLDGIELSPVEVECCRQMDIPYHPSVLTSRATCADNKKFLEQGAAKMDLLKSMLAESQASTSRLLTIRIAGTTGAGKSTYLEGVRDWIEYAYGYTIYSGLDEMEAYIKELRSTLKIRNKAQPIVWMVDDVIKYPYINYTDIERYMDYYECLPPGSIVLLSDNIPVNIKSESWFLEMWRAVRAVFTSTPFVPTGKGVDMSAFPEGFCRRIGLCGSIWTKDGLVNMLPTSPAYVFKIVGTQVEFFNQVESVLTPIGSFHDISDKIMPIIADFVHGNFIVSNVRVTYDMLPRDVPHIKLKNMDTLRILLAKSPLELPGFLTSNPDIEVTDPTKMVYLTRLAPSLLISEHADVRDVVATVLSTAHRALLAKVEINFGFLIGNTGVVLKDGICYVAGLEDSEIIVDDLGIRVLTSMSSVEFPADLLYSLTRGEVTNLTEDQRKIISQYGHTPKMFLDLPEVKQVLFMADKTSAVTKLTEEMEAAKRKILTIISRCALATLGLGLMAFSTYKIIKYLRPETEALGSNSNDRAAKIQTLQMRKLQFVVDAEPQGGESNPSLIEKVQQIVNGNRCRIHAQHSSVWGLGVKKNLVFFPAHVAGFSTAPFLEVEWKGERGVLRHISFIEGQDLAVGHVSFYGRKNTFNVFKDITKYFVDAESPMQFGNCHVFLPKSSFMDHTTFPFQMLEEKIRFSDGSKHDGWIILPAVLGVGPITKPGDCGAMYLVENLVESHKCILGMHIGRGSRFLSDRPFGAVMVKQHLDLCNAIPEGLVLHPGDSTNYNPRAVLRLDEFGMRYITPNHVDFLHTIPTEVAEKFIQLGRAEVSYYNPKKSTIKKLPVEVDYDTIKPTTFVIPLDKVDEFDWPDNKVQLDANGQPSPLMAGIYKYGMANLPIMTSRIAQQVNDAVTNTYLMLIMQLNIRFGKLNLSPLTTSAVINGVGVESDEWHLNPLERRSKAGVFAQRMLSADGIKERSMPTKGDLLIQSASGKYIFKPSSTALAVKHRYFRRCDLAKEKENLFSVSKLCLKDEKLPKRKLPRLFELLDMDLVMFIRRYTGEFIALVQSIRGFHYAFRCDPVRDFPVYADYLQGTVAPYQGVKRYWCNDFKRFDGSVHPYLMRHFIGMIGILYPEDITNVFDVIGDALIYTISQAYSLLFVKTQGNPSGNPLTTVMNTVIADWMDFIVWQTIFHDVFKTKFTWWDWEHGCKVRRLGLGDDGCGMVIIPKEFEKVNVWKLYVDYHADIFGMEVTWGTKEVHTRMARSISEISFLSRQFVPYTHENKTYFAGALKPTSIEALLLYTSLLSPSQIVDNWNDAVFEAFFHGELYLEATFNTCVSLAQAMQHKILISPTVLAELRASVLQRLHTCAREGNAWIRNLTPGCNVVNCYCDYERAHLRISRLHVELRSLVGLRSQEDYTTLSLCSNDIEPREGSIEQDPPPEKVFKNQEGKTILFELYERHKDDTIKGFEQTQNIEPDIAKRLLLLTSQRIEHKDDFNSTIEMDIKMNSTPVGPVGTTLSGHVHPEMRSGGGVIATNTNTNQEAFQFGNSPIQSFRQRGLKSTLLDQCYVNSVETESYQLPIGSPRDTVVFEKVWGDFTRGALRYWASAHRDVTGDTIIEARVIGNSLFTGAVIIAWVPSIAVVATVNDLMQYDYQILTVNQTQTYTFVNHNSVVSSFYSQVDTTGKVVLAERGGKIVMLVHTPVQPASDATSAYISIAVTERFATEADITLGAMPMRFNWARSDNELSALLGGGSAPLSNIYSPVKALRSQAYVLGVDSIMSTRHLAGYSRITSKSYGGYDPYKNMGKFLMPPIFTHSDPDAHPYPASAGNFIQTTAQMSIGQTAYGYPTVSQVEVDEVLHPGCLPFSEYVGCVFGRDGTMARGYSFPAFSDFDAIENYLITSEDCVYAASHVMSQSLHWEMYIVGVIARGGYYDNEAEFTFDGQILNCPINPVADGVPLHTGGSVTINGRIPLVGIVNGYRADGSTISVAVLHYLGATTKSFLRMLDTETDLGTYLVPDNFSVSRNVMTANNAVIKDQALVLAKTATDVVVTYPMLIDFTNINPNTTVVFSSTISSDVYQNPLGLKQLRLITPEGLPTPVQSTLSGTNAMVLSTSLDERLWNQSFVNAMVDYALVRFGPGSGTITLEAIWNPIAKGLFVDAPEFSTCTLLEQNLNIVEVTPTSSSTVPRRFDVWTSRVVPVQMKKNLFGAPALASIRLPDRGRANASAEMYALAGGLAMGVGGALSSIGQRHWNDRMLDQQHQYQLELLLKEQEFALEQARLNAVARGATTKGMGVNRETTSPRTYPPLSHSFVPAEYDPVAIRAESDEPISVEKRHTGMTPMKKPVSAPQADTSTQVERVDKDVQEVYTPGLYEASKRPTVDTFTDAGEGPSPRMKTIQGPVITPLVFEKSPWEMLPDDDVSMKSVSSTSSGGSVSRRSSLSSLSPSLRSASSA